MKNVMKYFVGKYFIKHAIPRKIEAAPIPNKNAPNNKNGKQTILSPK
jgi:hypothetical protein